MSLSGRYEACDTIEKIGNIGPYTVYRCVYTCMRACEKTHKYVTYIHAYIFVFINWFMKYFCTYRYIHIYICICHTPNILNVAVFITTVKELYV